MKINTNNGCMDFVTPMYYEYDVCDAFAVTMIIRSLDKKQEPDIIRISANDHNIRWYELDIPVTTLYGMRGVLLTELAKKGLVIPSRFEDVVVEYLTNGYKSCKAKSNIEYYHSGLGWFEYNGELVYLHERNLLKSGIISYSSRDKFKFQHGNKTQYEQFLEKTVYPCNTLALSMAIGYSAVLFSYLKDDYDTGEAVVVNLCGASSTGKSTVSQLLVSPFGCPDISNSNSLARTFHSTSNALFASLNGIKGVPIVLDDITTNPNINVPNLIYTLASGEEKSRCTSDGSVKDTGEWNGMIVISSETPIEESSLQNQGLKVRVLNTQGITWTPDADTAEEIKRFVKRNYGFTGIDFANYVASLKKEYVCDKYEDARDLVNEMMVNRDKLSDRLEIKYAVIALTIELMNQCFKLKLDSKELMKILITPEQNSVEHRDIAKRALEHVKNFVITKRKNFYERKMHGLAIDERYNMGDNCGTIVHNAETTDVYIPTDRLDSLLKSNGIMETATVKTKWRDAGITKCDSGRTDCKLFKRRCIHFIFDKGILLDNEPTFEQKSVTNPKPVPEEMLSTPVDNTDWDDDEAIRRMFEEDLGG